jgi:hypothetical protein
MSGQAWPRSSRQGQKEDVLDTQYLIAGKCSDINTNVYDEAFWLLYRNDNGDLGRWRNPRHVKSE